MTEPIRAGLIEKCIAAETRALSAELLVKARDEQLRMEIDHRERIEVKARELIAVSVEMEDALKAEHGYLKKAEARVKLLEQVCGYALSEEGPEVCFSEKLRAQLEAGSRGEEIPE